MIVILEIIGTVIIAWTLLAIVTVGLFHGAKTVYIRRHGRVDP